MTDDAEFILNHGVYEPLNGTKQWGNDALRFLTSKDLRTWSYHSTNHPDPRWYKSSGRWDHMYMSADTTAGGRHNASP